MQLPILEKLSPQKVAGKTFLVRADLDVPLEKVDGSWQVAEDKRLQQAKQTIEFICSQGGKCILMGHIGRPKNADDTSKSAQPIAQHLDKMLDQTVLFAEDCIGEKRETAQESLEVGQVLVLENTRYHDEEQKNVASFAKKLASNCDFFVNEAFATAHRAHASTVGVATYLPALAGFSFAKEVETLQQLIENPERPFVMVIGGAKISDKVEAVEHLSKIADVVLVGGGVANNFLKADGFDIAKSYLQDTPADLKKKGVDYVDVAEDLIQETKQERMMINDYIPLPKILYPTDVIAAPNLDSEKGEEIELVNGNHKEAQAKNLMYLDIGPKTTRLFKEVILQAGTVFWNGPMGVFENEAFANGTREVGKAIAKSSATTILGGGDTIAAIREFGLEDRYDYVSGAGGASLEFLSGKTLAAIAALETSSKKN